MKEIQCIQGSPDMRPIPGFPDYKATADGRIWSESRITQRQGKPMRVGGKFMRAQLLLGYPRMRVVAGGKRQSVFVHNLVASAFHGEAAAGFIVDHINGKRADNRPENLRFATASQNTANSVKRSDSRNRFKGVQRINGGRYYAARIQKDGKRWHVGCFATEIEAAEAYDKAAKEQFKEFAKTNFTP